MADIPLDEKNANTGLIGIGPIPGKAPVAAHNLSQIDSLLQTKGMLNAYHYRYAYLPDRESLEAGVDVSSEAANNAGVIYYDVRKITIVPYSFKLESQLKLDSEYGFGSCTLNVAGQYSDGDKERAYFAPRDLIVLDDSVTAQYRQLAEFNPNGDLRLKYKVKGVDYLASKTERYEEGPDFVITQEGTIRWVKGGNKPEPREILSVVYWFTPVYIVNSVPHYLRLIPENSFGLGSLPRDFKYAPQLLICMQSHLMEANALDFSSLPQYSGWEDTPNTTGGSF